MIADSADRTQEGNIIMNKLLSLLALFGVMAIAGATSSSTANASQLSSALHSFTLEQASAVEKAYYYRRHYYHRHHYHRHYRRWY